MTNNNNHPNCCHEDRFTAIEREITELKTRMDNKKEDIHNINKELYNDRQQQLQLIEKVTEVTVLLKESQNQRMVNNKRFDDIEKKVDKLQNELTETKNALTDYSSSQRSFRNTMLALIPVISIIVGVILHYF